MEQSDLFGVYAVVHAYGVEGGYSENVDEVGDCGADCEVACFGFPAEVHAFQE